MLYAASKDRFRRELEGIHFEIQATDPTEMDLEVIRDRANWKNPSLLFLPWQEKIWQGLSTNELLVLASTELYSKFSEEQ